MLVIVFGSYQAASSSQIQIPSLPWWVWVIIWLGILLGIALEGAYRLIRKQNDNWIDNYWYEYGRYPSIPQFLLPIIGNYKAGNPISKDITVIPASGQFLYNLYPSQKEKLHQLLEWLGKDPRDYEEHTKRMMPRTPPGVLKRKWRPYEQH